MSLSNNIVIVDAKRTPVCNFNGGFSTLKAHELGKAVIESLIENTKVSVKDISQVILGQVLTSNCGQNPARQSSIKAGLPFETPALTINQVCGSGLRAIALGVQSILSGESEIVIAGGQENMTLAPHACNIRSGVKMGNANFEDTMIKDGLWEAFNDYHMGVTAENIAKKYKITRQMQDEFALDSQQKAKKALEQGSFDNELVKVTISTRKGDIVVDKDEFPRPDTSIESLSKLRPAFSKSGSVTAGNASGINDGAAAVILMTQEEASKRGLTPLATIKSFAQCGVDPEIMGTGPIPASKKALKNAGWSVDDLDLIEANEAFAAQAMSVNQEMNWDLNKVNVNGGAIALGHPIGASGARIIVTLLHEMQKRNSKKGLATLCIGGGMGVAMCFERN